MGNTYFRTKLKSLDPDPVRSAGGQQESTAWKSYCSATQLTKDKKGFTLHCLAKCCCNESWQFIALYKITSLRYKSLWLQKLCLSVSQDRNLLNWSQEYWFITNYYVVLSHFRYLLQLASSFEHIKPFCLRVTCIKTLPTNQCAAFSVVEGVAGINLTMGLELPAMSVGVYAVGNRPIRRSVMHRDGCQISWFIVIGTRSKINWKYKLAKQPGNPI